MSRFRGCLHVPSRGASTNRHKLPTTSVWCSCDCCPSCCDTSACTGVTSRQGLGVSVLPAVKAREEWGAWSWSPLGGEGLGGNGGDRTRGWEVSTPSAACSPAPIWPRGSGLWGFLPQSDWCPVPCRLLTESCSLGSSLWAVVMCFAHLETPNSKSSRSCWALSHSYGVIPYVHFALKPGEGATEARRPVPSPS